MKKLLFDDTIELEARYDSRKSFYGKAHIRVTQDDNAYMEELISYSTVVASYIRDNFAKIYKYFGKYSQTTTRHQREFFKQLGLGNKEIDKLFKEGELIIC